MSRDLTVGSLFSGIGSFDLGLERAGMRVLWQCEQDEYRRRILAHHWPGLPIYPDVSELRAADCTPIDVLCGGFPCQDLSAAGKGAGLAGARSGLWSEYARLVGELRPRYVIVENVPPLRRRGLNQVLADLDACGYDAEWDGISASAIGAPHQRDRLWIVAYPRESELRQQSGRREGTSGADQTLAGVNGAPRNMAHSAWDAETRSGAQTGTERQRTGEGGQRGGTTLADTKVEPVGAGLREGDPGGLGRRRSGNSGRASRAGAAEPNMGGVADGSSAGLAEHWRVEAGLPRVADGVVDRTEQLEALGDSLVPQIAQWVGERIVSFESMT